MNTIEVKRILDIHSAVIYLDRPDRMNSISTELATELLQALNELEDDPEIWCVALTGRGDKAFCTGADLKERKDMDHMAMKKQRALFVKLFERTSFFPKPLVAFVNGFAFAGGFELALGCDYIIASDNATFALTEVSLGIIPAGGGTQNLSRLIGKSKAKEIILTAKRFDVQEAQALGAVNRVCAAADLEQEMLKELKAITKNAPLALQQAKRSINYGIDQDLHTGLTLEAECYNVLLKTEDRDEGLRAFNEKRPPVYRGK